MKGWVNHTHGMWITHLDFVVYVFISHKYKIRMRNN